MSKTDAASPRLTFPQMFFSIFLKLHYIGKNKDPYLQKFTGGPDWRITLKYTVPNIVFSVIFNLPKFFEFDVQEIVETNSETNMTYAKINLNPTNLRLDDNYVYYYVNWSRFLVSGLIPLVGLTVLNFAIYR